MSKEHSREDVKNLVDHMSKKQTTLVYDLLAMFMLRPVSKGEITKLVVGDGTVDSALPHDYVMAIQAIHPNFDVHSHVYDYRTASHGEMFNVAEGLIAKLAEELKI